MAKHHTELAAYSWAVYLVKAGETLASIAKSYAVDLSMISRLV